MLVDVTRWKAGEVVDVSENDATWLVNVGKATTNFVDPVPIPEPEPEPVPAPKPARKPRAKRAK